MAKKAAKAKENPLLTEAKERFQLALDAWKDNRKAWLEDAKFLAGDQWPDEVKKVRNIPGKERPMLVVDKLGQYVRQVVNDGRQNRPSVKVRPIDGGGDVEVADAFQGIIRHIWDRSNADQAADTALEHAVKGGFGFIRLTTDYAYENTFEQEICIKRIRNPLCVLLDPNIQEADGSDARFGFVIDEIPKDRFEQQYPQAKATDWEYDAKKYSDEWLPDGNVRVVEYFYKVDVPKTLLLLDDGTSILEEDYQRDQMESQQEEQGEDPNEVEEPQPQVVDQREITSCEVRWARLTGAEILEENKWLGKYIPIIPVFGNEEDIDGKVVYSGLIRKAKDAQRLYNFSRSAFAERVALAPKAPFIGADEAVADFIDDWEEANTANTAVLRYRHLDEQGNPIPMPQRQAPSDIPSGFAQDAEMSEHDIQGAMGMYNASLGERSNEKSGKAIIARKSEGDMATFHFQDNQSRAIGYLGLQLIDLIPKIIDSKRAIRILGEDGNSTAAHVDPQQPMPVMKMNGPDGEPMTIYNLNAGKYDVSVAAGPSYTTKRQEAVEAMMQLTQSAPQFLQVAGDIMVRNMDWPGAQEIADRLQKMLPPQLQDNGNQSLPPQVQQAMQQIQQGQQQLAAGHAQLQQAAQQVAQDKAVTDAQKVKLEALSKELDAKDKILQANYQELSAKLELQATKLGLTMPQKMPPGKDEPGIDPTAPVPAPAPTNNPQAPSGAFLTPGA